jgi:hypothetical protein
MQTRRNEFDLSQVPAWLFAASLDRLIWVNERWLTSNGQRTTPQKLPPKFRPIIRNRVACRARLLTVKRGIGQTISRTDISKTHERHEAVLR